MAADVSSLVRFLQGYKDDRTVGNEPAAGKSSALITRDLLGVDDGGFRKNDDSQELDLDLQVPNGWEKRLDLKSGKVYLQRCDSSNSPSSSSDHGHHQANQTVPKVQDLNFPPSPSKISLNLFDDNLELKLVSSASSAEPSSSSSNYLSVCTIDRVKTALERAEKELVTRKRSTCLLISSLSPPYSTSSSSMREIREEGNEEKIIWSPVAAGCPGCLSYVLIMKHNPKCPRCNSVVPMPVMKKPRIDLNVSM